ncbi:MAG: ceramidase domain-containing protein [Pseudomonadota bacterium]
MNIRRFEDRGMHDDPMFVTKLGLIIGLILAALVIAFLSPPIPQDPSYHVFADQRMILGIPNFWNVVSNLAFLFVGIAGLYVVGQKRPAGGIPALRMGYAVFFAGITLIAIGSGFYHLDPSNVSLVWDRLPMTLSFMAFFGIIIGENISISSGIRLLWPLIGAGLFSVAYWYSSELQGRGDLRLYALIQFLPMLLIPVILLLFRSPFSGNAWVWLVICAYGASKVAELADTAIFESLGVGGHALKHLLAALGALLFLAALLLRSPRDRIGPSEHGEKR